MFSRWCFLQISRPIELICTTALQHISFIQNTVACFVSTIQWRIVGTKLAAQKCFQIQYKCSNKRFPFKCIWFFHSTFWLFNLVWGHMMYSICTEAALFNAFKLDRSIEHRLQLILFLLFIDFSIHRHLNFFAQVYQKVYAHSFVSPFVRTLKLEWNKNLIRGFDHKSPEEIVPYTQTHVYIGLELWEKGNGKFQKNERPKKNIHRFD